MINVVSTSFAILAILSNIFVLITIVAWVSEKVKSCRCYTKLKKFISPFAYEFAFVVSLVATLGSLFYSEIAHFTPCKLCWYQRILMYPQPLLFYMAILRRERVLTPYLMTISIIGLFIALYHIGLQTLPALFVPCGNDVVSCGKAYVGHFGFITIPYMSAAAFLLLFTLLTLSRKTK